MLFQNRDILRLTRIALVPMTLGIIHRELQHPTASTVGQNTAAMSTLMRTLRNLRKIGLKVSTFHSYH